MRRDFGKTRQRAAFWLPIGVAVLAWVPGCSVKFGDNGTSDCGNGVVKDPEACDDGNQDNNDGCSSTCEVEEGWSCSGEPSVCETTCGDGLARGQEVCDGEDLKGFSCQTLGLGDGQLACSAGCVFDVLGCSVQAECGNLSVEYPEECDGVNLAGKTCRDMGFDEGTLACGQECTFDTSECRNTAVCGDGVAEGAEECDGAELNGQTCESLGLDQGTLACKEDCTFDVSNCSGRPDCGNGTIQFPELCDGADLGGYDCTAFGYLSGTLACLPDCTNFDVTGCQGLCGDGSVDSPEVCDGANLGGQDCTDHGFYSGTLACESDCLDFNTSGCHGYCGDGAANGPEVCDGADLDGQDCQSATGGQLPLGTLACSGNCQSFDTSGCGNCAGHNQCPAGQQCVSTVCQAVGNTCSDSPTVITSSGTYNHTTVNLLDNYNGGGAGLNCPGLSFNFGNGPDRVYEVPLNAGQYMSVWITPDNWDAYLFLSTQCPINSCVGGADLADQSAGSERLDYIAQSTGTVYLVVDGDDAPDFGDYTLEVTIGSPVAQAGSLGEVIFSEIHNNPTVVADDCEWIEIYNPSATTALDLDGVVFSSTNGNVTITRTRIILPLEHMVVAFEADLHINCGMDRVSWMYAGTPFETRRNAPCQLEMRRGASTIDMLNYDPGWPYGFGQSMYLCTNHMNHIDNDSSSNWAQTPAQAQYLYSSGLGQEYGTPAAANPGTCN